MYSIILAICIIMSLCLTSASAQEDNCAQDKRVIAACYHIQGTLSVYANLRPYLNPSHTKEKIGIAYISDTQQTDYFWPKIVEENLDPEHSIGGDFYVCPFKRSRSGKSDRVCIDSVEKLEVLAR